MTFALKYIYIWPAHYYNATHNFIFFWNHSTFKGATEAISKGLHWLHFMLPLSVYASTVVEKKTYLDPPDAELR